MTIKLRRSRIWRFSNDGPSRSQGRLGKFNMMHYVRILMMLIGLAVMVFGTADRLSQRVVGIAVWLWVCWMYFSKRNGEGQAP